MKISTSCEHGIAAGLTARESLRLMKAAGFEGIDLSLCRHMNEPEKYLTKEWTASVLEQVRTAKDEGLEIAQCHLPYYPGHLENPGDGSAEAFGEYWLPMYFHGLEAAEKAGAKIAVIHPMYHEGGRQATVDANVYLWEKMRPALKQSGIKLAFENVFIRRERKYIRAFLEEAEVMREIADAMDADTAGLCMDTGHANIFRFDICEYARTFADRLICLHVNANSGEDEHIIPLSGAAWCERMDFEAFSRTLNEIGYKGWYNLEVSGGRFPKAAARPFYEYAAIVARHLADAAQC
ncbi:MAG: sugar phosphate isomerase/epimerase [Clostridiales bacterium]|nr:sugar phosphate isomerase/epimerase [Clostridiales bacterium]